MSGSKKYIIQGDRHYLGDGVGGWVPKDHWPRPFPRVFTDIAAAAERRKWWPNLQLEISELTDEESKELLFSKLLHPY